MKSGISIVGKLTVMTVVLLSAVYAVWQFPAWLTKVESYSISLSEFSTFGPDVDRTQLPLADRQSLARDPLPIEGQFDDVQLNTGHDSYVYLPYFSGDLEIFFNGVLIYDSTENPLPNTIISISDALIHLPTSDNQGLQSNDGRADISFILQPDQAGLASMSRIYVGTRADFLLPIMKNYLYYDVFRSFLLGIQVFLLIMGCLLLVLDGFSTQIFVNMCLLLFVALIGLSGYVNQIPDFKFSGPMFIALSPAASIYILLFGWMLCFGALGRRVFVASVLISVAWFFILPGLLAQGVAITQINLTLSGPLLIFSFLALLAMAGLRLLRSFSADVVIMGVVSIILLASVFYDFQYRNGLVTTGAALAPLGSAVFVTFVGYISVKHYTFVNLELARANVDLRLALKDQSEQLKADFAKVTLLERQAAVREEVSRLTRELHDGVLSYLGIINVVSEAGKDETLARIHQLSRLATNEIRIILDARPSDEASLAIAMSSLKQHVVDPLRLAGVSVEWSTRALTDYGRVEPKFLMNVVRIVQEAIHNAVISAGSVHLSVLAEHSDRVTCITITNTGGQPFCDDDKSGLGIVSMHERARKIGARLDIAPLPDGAILTLKMAQNNLG